jgi:hypothetical protein
MSQLPYRQGDHTPKVAERYWVGHDQMPRLQSLHSCQQVDMQVRYPMVHLRQTRVSSFLRTPTEKENLFDDAQES